MFANISDATVHLRVSEWLRQVLLVDLQFLACKKYSSRPLSLCIYGQKVGAGSADNTWSDLSPIDEFLEMHEMHSRFDLLKIQKT